MKIYKLFVGVILSFCALGTTSVFAQSGDQILDGIGETGLIARYVFDGDVKDWSRNNCGIYSGSHGRQTVVAAAGPRSGERSHDSN